eukprot:2951029-Prymnesium_polylepis.1
MVQACVRRLSPRPARLHTQSTSVLCCLVCPPSCSAGVASISRQLYLVNERLILPRGLVSRNLVVMLCVEVTWFGLTRGWEDDNDGPSGFDGGFDGGDGGGGFGGIDGGGGF